MSDSMKDFGFNKEGMANILINEIYDGYKSSLRELLTNGVSAIVEAQREGYINKGKLEISIVKNKDDTNTLVFRDNGIGMSRDLIENIVSVMGKSRSRGDTKRIGQFGIGFMSYFKLNNSFDFITKSRKTDEVINGEWRIDRFVESDETVETDYGTSIKINVPEGKLSFEQIKSELYNYSKYARTTVELKTFKGDELIESETYGYSNIEDFYDDPKFLFVVENDYYRAVASEQANGDMILLDIPVGNYDEFEVNNDINIDVRLKVEDDIKIRTNGYSSVKYPAPTGSREQIKNSSKFASHVSELIEDKIKDEIDIKSVSSGDGSLSKMINIYDPSDIGLKIVDVNLFDEEDVYIRKPFSRKELVVDGYDGGKYKAKFKRKIGLDTEIIRNGKTIERAKNNEGFKIGEPSVNINKTIEYEDT